MFIYEKSLIVFVIQLLYFRNDLFLQNFWQGLEISKLLNNDLVQSSKSLFFWNFKRTFIPLNLEYVFETDMSDLYL